MEEKPRRPKETVAEEAVPKPKETKPLVAPTVTIETPSVTASDNQNVTITAKFTGQPKPTVAWYQDDKPLVPSSRIKIQVDSKTNTATLTILKTNPEDSGTFTVKIDNEAGKGTASADLTILTKPEPPQNCVITEITSDSVTIKWDKPKNDGGSPIRNYVIRKKLSKRTTWAKVTSTTDEQVVITDLEEGVSYDFRISAETDQGESAPVELGPVAIKPGKEIPTVTAKTVELPTVTVKNPLQEISLGQPIDVEVTFTGEPKPVLTWTLNGKEIVPSRRLKIEEARREPKVTFTIPKTEDSDSGTYTITAKNETGSTSTEFTIKVLKKSGPPEDVTVTELTIDSATVSWQEPIDDGGSPVKHYIIQKQVVGRSWQKVTTTTETTVTVNDLLKGTKYNVRVVPVTEQGEGEPAEIGPITPREPAPAAAKPTAKPDEKPSGKSTKVPTIKVRKPLQEIPVGQSVDVEVSFTGEPRPTLEWTLNGTSVIPSRHVRIEESSREMKTVFTIPKTEETDSGTYTVSATNEAGSITEEFTLKILSKPSAPQSLVVTEITSTTATITWDAPEKDGGKPIKHYIIHKKVVGRSWTKVTTTRETKFTLTDLLQKTNYNIKVTPVTDQGEGEPAEVSLVLLTGKFFAV